MDRSRKILDKIASATHRVVTAANEHADRKDLSNVERAHFQLEEEMQKISVACECLTSTLPMSPLPHAPSFDERLKDWLISDEPRMCCETLDQMERLLQEDASLRTSTSMRVRGMTPTKDKISEAVNLFDSRKRCFRLLFTTDIWCVPSASASPVHGLHYYPGTMKGASNSGVMQPNLRLDSITSRVKVPRLSEICEVPLRRVQGMFYGTIERALIGI